MKQRHSYHSSKAVKIAHDKSEQNRSVSATVFFNQCQKCSIGFNSGKYGGKKITVLSYFLAILKIRFFLWNEALSKIITVSLGTSRNKCPSNHVSKKIDVHCSWIRQRCNNFAFHFSSYYAHYLIFLPLYASFEFLSFRSSGVFAI